MTHIFFLAGAPAVGKSTTARRLAERFQRSVHIPVDTIRTMVVAGVVHPGDDWGPDLIEQLALAREHVTQMALRYNQAGFVVTIDDFWDPNSHLHEYDQLFQQPNTHRILLHPRQQAAEERNQQRSGSRDERAYIAAGISTVYKHLHTEVSRLELLGWMVVDTTDMDVETTVTYILAQTR